MTDLNTAVQAARDAGASPVVNVGNTIMGIAATKLSAIGIWTAVVGGFFTILGIIVRSRVPMRKLKIEAEEQLRIDLMSRMDTMSKDHASEKADLIRRIEAVEQKQETMRAQYEAKIERQRSESTTEISFLRHKMNNLDQAFNGFLMLVEANPEDPEKIRAAVRMARQMRERHEQEEKDEKKSWTAAKVAATEILTARLGEPNGDIV